MEEGYMIFICIKRGKFVKGFTSIIILISAIFALMVAEKLNVRVFENGMRKLPIYCVDTKEKKVALTFDASWGEDKTDKIIEVLERYNAKGTFFLVGAWVDAHPDKLKLIFDKGHEIGNHTNRHPNMNTITKEGLIKEIEVADNKIKNITGKGTVLFRSPSGDYNDTVLQAVESTKRYCIQWNVDSIDWKAEGADVEFNRVIKKTIPGSIILFHNEAPYTPENLPRIIEYLQKQNYKFVTVSQLIYKDNYYIDYSGKQISNKNN
jgi:peptidoglycan-N-acetylglucosamine deacetylase